MCVMIAVSAYAPMEEDHTTIGVFFQPIICQVISGNSLVIHLKKRKAEIF